MPDLPGRKRSEPARLVGADPTTNDETNPVGATANNDLMVVDTANTSAVYGNVSFGTTAVEAKVGASPLVVRKCVHLQAKDKGVLWGYDASVTTTTGTELFKDLIIFIPAGPNVSIYLVGDAAGKNVRVGELA